MSKLIAEDINKQVWDLTNKIFDGCQMALVNEQTYECYDKCFWKPMRNLFNENPIAFVKGTIGVCMHDGHLSREGGCQCFMYLLSLSYSEGIFEKEMCDVMYMNETDKMRRIQDNLTDSEKDEEIAKRFELIKKFREIDSNYSGIVRLQDEIDSLGM